jgi:hypothetical protein
MLILELFAPKMHVYAPGVQGYKPIEWSMAGRRELGAAKPDFPPSRMLRLPAIGETVPVYEEPCGSRVNSASGVERRRWSAIVEGLFRYQACDDKGVLRAEQVPLKWYSVAAIDSVRVPPELRKVQ